MSFVFVSMAFWLLAKIGISPIAVAGTDPSNFFFGQDSIYTFLGFCILMGGAAALTYVRGSDKSLHTVIYGSFAVAFYWTYDGVSNIFGVIGLSIPFDLHISTIFMAVIGIIFIVGFAQMATGGWRSYE